MKLTAIDPPSIHQVNISRKIKCCKLGSVEIIRNVAVINNKYAIALCARLQYQIVRTNKLGFEVLFSFDVLKSWISRSLFRIHQLKIKKIPNTLSRTLITGTGDIARSLSNFLKLRI